jgi:hypothetical protein
VLHDSDEPEQLSSKDTTGMVTLAEQVPEALLAVRLPGQVTEGSSLSVTVTVKEHVAVRSAPSVTVRVTVVTPALKVCVPG